MGHHVIPYLGRNHSGAVTQNLLWQDGHVYLMDNHRAALWCWQQHCDLYAQPHRILHIDRHYDALGANLDLHLNSLPDLRGLSIHDYLGATVLLHEKVPLFRWDNYLSIHLAKFGQNLRLLRCLTHEDGDKPNFKPVLESPPEDLPENLKYWLCDDGDIGWIVNVDLDYFFCADASGDFIPMISTEYVDATFAALRVAMDQGAVKVITVCLTPSHFTPGWQACIDLSARIFRILHAQYPQI
jgi:hypothetical protein